MLNVLSTTKFVVDRSKDVKIDLDAIHALVDGINREELQTYETNLSNKNWGFETMSQIIFIFNSINFCYWAGKDEEKWKVNINGEEFDGAIALYRCLEKETDNNPDFLTGSYLANLTSTNLKAILAGNVTIPLFDQRLKCLHQIGKILEKQFDNSFLNVLAQSDNDALALAEILVDRFSYFNDVSDFKGKKIGFYKKAQLNSKMISDNLLANNKPELNNLSELTAFADYKIPQILRDFGVLRYSKELAQKIDNYELIESNSVAEVEIRSASIWAVETIRQRLGKKFGRISAAQVDSMLWNLSQTRKIDFPYHRTLTIAY